VKGAARCEEGGGDEVNFVLFGCYFLFGKIEEKGRKACRRNEGL
jgi:hypothetical protein